MSGEDQQLECGGPQKRGGQTRDPHDDLPYGTAGAALPRVPSWEARVIEAGVVMCTMSRAVGVAVPPCRAAVGAVVRRPVVDLRRLPVRPCLRGPRGGRARCLKRVRRSAKMSHV
ncbi:hypothetical protein GCM10010381_30760 [Streptomyces xantholiticus]|nr:hypothetical protein GCM10010381_30760 [Streptomyces xantholiticus]